MIYQNEWLPLDAADPARERTLRRLAAVGVLVFVAYLALTLGHGLSRPTLSLLFNVLLLPVPVAAWSAYIRSRPPLRRVA